MINIYICDDDPMKLSSLKKVFKRLAAKHELDVCIKGFYSGYEMIQEYNRDWDVVDIVCLNTVVKKESGIEIGKKLKCTGYDGEIIFFAEDEKHVLESFEVRPLAYIIKKMDNYIDFQNVFLTIAKKIINQPKQCLLCSQAGIVKRIPLKDIKYIDIHGRTSKIHYKSEIFEIYMGLSILEKSLDEKSFIRINRSSLVNANYIKEKSDKSVKLVCGEEINIGDKYLDIINDRLTDPFWEPCHLT